MSWRSSLYRYSFLPSPAGKIRRDHAGAEPGLWKDAIFGRISLETNSEWKPPENRGPSPQPSEKRNFIFQSHGIFSGFCSLLVSGRVSPPRVKLLMENSNIFAAQYWLPEKLSASFCVGECHTTTTLSQTHSVGMTGWYIEKLCVSLFEKSWGIHNCLDRRPSYRPKFGPNWIARVWSTWKTSCCEFPWTWNHETSHPVALKKGTNSHVLQVVLNRLRNDFSLFDPLIWVDFSKDANGRMEKKTLEFVGLVQLICPMGENGVLWGWGSHVANAKMRIPEKFYLPIIFFRCKPG